MNMTDMMVTAQLSGANLILCCSHADEAPHVGVSSLVQLGILKRNAPLAHAERLTELLGFDCQVFACELAHLLPTDKYTIEITSGSAAQWRPRFACRANAGFITLSDVVEFDSLLSTLGAEVDFSTIYRHNAVETAA